MSAAATTTAGVIALARTTPLVRRAVEDLAKKVPGPLAAKAAEEALDTAGAPAALVLAFAAIASGAKIAPPLTRALLPEVLSLDQVGPLVYATEGGPVDVLVAFLDDKWGDLELECLALLLLAEERARAEAPPTLPRSLLTRARWLARHKLNEDAGLFLGGAAIRLGDASFASLASRDVNRAKRNKRVIEETLAIARAPALESLPEVDGSRVSSGFTVKNAAPAVGRNDPCPCGSGKKYKKCHALETAAPLAAEAATQAIDAATLGPDQAALLRPSEIASLDTARLSPRAFVEAFRRVVDFRQWDLALRMIGEAKKVGTEEAPLVLDALHGTYEAGAAAAAEKLYALLPEAQATREAFALDCLRRQPDLLDRIEREAEEALRNDADGGRGMLFAASLLRWFPALGIYAARGALHEGRVADSQALLERIEDARDRLLLSPHEAWWDVFEAFFSEPDESAPRREKKDDAKRAKLKEDLRLARASSRKLGIEMEKLKSRVEELDETMAAGPAPTSASIRSSPAAPTAADPALADERRRLKSKIDELVRIIGEGQDERRDLRRQLAERDERAARDDDRDGEAKPSERDEDDDAGESPDEGASVDLPRVVLVPRFSERAAKTLADLAGDAADGVLSVVAALAAGKPNAWSGVKQLTKVRGVLSARAGIHHRVLFSTDAPGRQLDVLEVLHRKDLEQVVARLARVGAAP